MKGSPSTEKEFRVDAVANITQELHSDSSRKLRILCLHGLRTSGKIMAQQIAMANWALLMDDIAELVFMDAPLPARKAFSLEKKFPGPYFEWFQSSTSTDSTSVLHLEKTISHFSDYVTLHGPFDALMGFSQGGIFSAALMGLYQKGMGPKILSDIKFLILVGAGRELGNSSQVAYTDIIKCPSIHFIGDEDFMKPSGESLARVFEDPVVIRHRFGHLFPRLSASEGQIFRDFLLKQLQSKFPSPEGNYPIKVTSLL